MIFVCAQNTDGEIKYIRAETKACGIPFHSFGELDRLMTVWRFGFKNNPKDWSKPLYIIRVKLKDGLQ